MAKKKTAKQKNRQNDAEENGVVDLSRLQEDMEAKTLKYRLAHAQLEKEHARLLLRVLKDGHLWGVMLNEMDESFGSVDCVAQLG